MAGVPGPSLLALSSFFIDALRHPGPVGQRLRARYGDAVRFGAGPMRYFMLFGAQANELVLGDRNDSFLWGPATKSLVHVDGPTALVVTDGEEHKRRRRLVQPAFAMRRIDGAVETMVEEVDRLIDGLVVGETIDLYPALRATVRRIVARVLFADAPSAVADELGGALEPALRFVERPPQLTGPGMPGRGRARRARDAADRIVDKELRRRRQTGDLGTDILGELLATDLSDVELRDQMVSLIAAGYATTSGAVAFAVLELLRHPEEWRSAEREVLDSTSPRGGPFIGAVVNETLRLWPTPFAGRSTTDAVRFAGYDIPPSSTIAFSPYVTHRDTELWGADAETFRPSRWIDEPEPGPFRFIPFGGAYRKCIGFGLAMAEMQVTVTRLVQRTSLRRVDPNADVQGTGIASMYPEHGVRVIVEQVR
jgi:cytochrome P450